MEVIRHNDVLIVRHSQGDPHTAEALCRGIEAAVGEIRGVYPRIAIMHDARGLDHIDESYARAFADCQRRLQRLEQVEIRQFAVIPKAIHRVFARYASTVGGLKTEICKTVEVCRQKMLEAGFTEAVVAA